MGIVKTAREQRAAELRRLEIGALVDEYRRFVPQEEQRRHQLLREELILTILDCQFPESAALD